MEGVAHRKVKSLGCTDQQYICARNNHIIWNELQVSIGLLLSEKGEIGLFTVALCLFMARAASIVCVHLTPAAIQSVSGGPSAWASGTHRRRSHPYAWLTR